MACANWLLTVFAVVIGIFALWPGISATVSSWVIVIFAVLIIITAWTAVVCKPCMRMSKKKKK